MTANAFRFMRMLLGIYVAVHFAMLVPYAAELFSSEGMLADAHLSPLVRAFPNVLAWCDGASFVTAFVASGMVAAALFALGIVPRSAAFAAYYVWACLFGRNPLILNPSLPYVGLMLLGCAAMRAKATDSERERLRTLLWVAMALGYSYSGLTKLSSPSWLDGTALREVLESPLARPGTLRELLLAANEVLLGVSSYVVLALETLFAPLALAPRLRGPLWAAMTSVHLGLVLLLQFADLSVGMLLLHVFTFDMRWLENARQSWLRKPVYAFARTPSSS